MEIPRRIWTVSYTHLDVYKRQLFVELARAYNLAGQYEQALDVLHGHTLVPCEGGEHAVADQYMFAQHEMCIRDSPIRC